MHETMLVRLDALHESIPDHFNLRILEQALLQDLGSAQLVAPMDQIHLLGIAREKVTLFDGGITATDNGDSVALEECTVADGAVGHTLPCILGLAGDAELDRRTTSRDYRSRCVVNVARLGLDVERSVLEAPDREHDTLMKLSTKFLCMTLEALREIPALDVLEAWIVFDRFGVEQLSARTTALDDHCLQHRSSGVHPCGHPSGTGTDDYDVIFKSLTHEFL